MRLDVFAFKRISHNVLFYARAKAMKTGIIRIIQI